MLSQETKEFLMSCGIEKEMQQLEDCCSDYLIRFIHKMYPMPENTKNMLGRNSMHYIQMALCRSKLLTDGVITALNAKNGLLAMLAARAHLEVTGALAFFLKKLNNYYRNAISYQILNEALQRLILGTKSLELSENAPAPVNVMTLIDAADEYLSKTRNEETKEFRENYNYLSEYCHPDFFGITMQSRINNAGITTYSLFYNLNEQDLTFLSSLMSSVSTFFLLFDSILELLMENEELPEYQ
ncbi:hypothetical protein [Ruminiclostridium cellulolyticum]|uniref:Uncharacterized protein n=1 Tax=Ruminiclostridium cellulolyticum (strain ATCC 35319 / DSM 5812 / JCM 6584 / H10) TaxID=394503 RepID=B8I6K6_RUMCH|nr:hypothetical protein [Ruminiclostridium cellulolyticum]ACL74898.1 hypothetical protein Ccel_0516 [Ruminiclostridium cellulolyticum H10]